MGTLSSLGPSPKTYILSEKAGTCGVLPSGFTVTSGVETLVSCLTSICRRKGHRRWFRCYIIRCRDLSQLAAIGERQSAHGDSGYSKQVAGGWYIRCLSMIRRVDPLFSCRTCLLHTYLQRLHTCPNICQIVVIVHDCPRWVNAGH